MKQIALIFLTAAAMVAVSCSSSTKQSENNQAQSFSLDTTQLKTGDVYYQCMMDTEILSDMPGKCPKCGMTLTKKAKQ